ncbi:MAG: hypothetical protein AAFR11_07000 [Pseudomonadota bacterium]
MSARRLAVLAAATALALAACEPRKTPETEEPAAETDAAVLAEPAADVGSFDEIGVFTDPIAGLAVWAHPTLPYRGAIAVAVAGEALQLRDFEGSRLDRRIGGYSVGLDIVYLGRGRTADAILVAVDRVDQSFVFHRITPLPIAFENLDGRFPSGGATGFCLGTDHETASFTLYVVDGSPAVAARRFSVAGTEVSAEGAGALRAETPLLRCAVDQRANVLYALDRDGAVWRARLSESAPRFERLIDGAGPAEDIDLVLQSNAGTPAADRGQIALLRGDAGAIVLHALGTGERLGAFKLVRYDGIAGVETPGAMATAFGNYGGVYRSGVAVVAERDASPAVRLAPWTAVANQVGFALFDTLDPRWPAVEEPEPAIALPVIEDNRERDRE